MQEGEQTLTDAPRPWAVRARWVFPVDRPPIQGGVVTILGDSILSVGKRSEHGTPADLGDVALLPGLVNAHTHLEFSGLTRPIGEPGMRFANWIGELVAYRRRQSEQVAEASEDSAAELLAVRRAAVRQGLKESLGHGVTTLGEIATAPWDMSPYADSTTSGTVFYELLGLDPERTPMLLDDAQRHLASPLLQTQASGMETPGMGTPGGWTAGLSPHAPYTVHPDLLREVVALSARQQTTLAMHLAETLEEWELLASHSGPLVERLTALRAWHPQAIPRGIAPYDYLQMLSAAHRVLVVHGNYLAEPEWKLLASNSDHMSLVYCPRTHAYFGHGAYPLAPALAAGVRVALGTDSRASNPDLDLLAEMRFVAQRHANVSPEQVLQMGTLSGAEALGLESRTGSLSAGKRADLVAVELSDDASGDEATDALEALLDSSLPVRQVIQGGRRW